MNIVNATLLKNKTRTKKAKGVTKIAHAKNKTYRVKNGTPLLLKGVQTFIIPRHGV
jgi:hypothetical protein